MAADLQSDGALGLAVSGSLAGSIRVLLGDGAGGFSTQPEVMVGAGPRSLFAGDFNADGTKDLAVTLDLEGSVSALLGDGTGGFVRAGQVSVGPGPAAL